MHATIRDSQGAVKEGVLLAVSKDKLRLILSSMADTIDLRRVEGAWQFDDGSTAEFEALVDVAGIGAFCADIFPRTKTAGS